MRSGPGKQLFSTQYPPPHLVYTKYISMWPGYDFFLSCTSYTHYFQTTFFFYHNNKSWILKWRPFAELKQPAVCLITPPPHQNFIILLPLSVVFSLSRNTFVLLLVLSAVELHWNLPMASYQKGNQRILLLRLMIRFFRAFKQPANIRSNYTNN